MGQRQRSSRSLGPSEASSPGLMGQRERSARHLGQRRLSKRSDLDIGTDTCDNTMLLQKPLLYLAKQQKFERIEEILTLLKAPALAAWLEDFGPAMIDAGLQAFKGETILHLIMQHRPPVELVDLLILRLKELKDGFVPENAADLRGRTPLHLAVYYFCDSSVIKRLVNGLASVVPVLSKDATGRLPLHWACENPQGLNSKGVKLLSCGNRSRRCDNMMEIIEILVKIYPHAVTMKDSSGSTPLNLALKNGAEPCTILLLDRMDQKLATESSITENDTKTESNAPVTFIGASHFLPFEVDDDMSSIGSGGVSTYNNSRGRFRGRPIGRNLFSHEQLLI